MNLFEDICPLFNVAMAIMSIAQLRFVAWQDILKAAATVSAVDKKKKNDQEEKEDTTTTTNNNDKQIRIRTILYSFQEATAPASAEQALLLELKEYFTSNNSNNRNNDTTIFGCPTADLEMAVTTLLLPQTMTQLLDCFTWYNEKSKEFRSFLKRPGVGSMDFHRSLLEMKNVKISAGDEDEDEDEDKDKDNPIAPARRRSTKTSTTPTSSAAATSTLLVACNNYRVDMGPSGKELIYMIFLDKYRERIIVTFRGSITLTDWAHDVRVNTHSMNNPFFTSSSSEPSPAVGSSTAQDKEKQQDGGGGDGGGGGVSTRSTSLFQERQLETLHIHAGFYRYLCMADQTTGEESKFDQILQKLHDLLKQHPTYKIVVAGHSLGGAASTLFAFMAAAAAASAATRGDNNNNGGGNDNADTSVDKKNVSERFRIWLPTPTKVARLFGGATAAAAAPQEPPSATQGNNHDDDDNQAKDEEEDSRMDKEGSSCHICLPTPITVVSFGSPTVGDEAFCRAFGLLEDHGILRHLRIANEDDIVPSIPVSSIPTTLERVYLYRHTGIPLIQLATQSVPVKQFFRWCIRKMNKQNQSEDTGATLFRISHGDRKKMKKNLDRKNNNASDWHITADVAVVAKDFADAVGGLHLRTPINHLPASYHTRLHRIKAYLCRLSLDQLYQEYLDFNNNNDDEGNDDDDVDDDDKKAKVE